MLRSEHWTLDSRPHKVLPTIKISRTDLQKLTNLNKAHKNWTALDFGFYFTAYLLVGQCWILLWLPNQKSQSQFCFCFPRMLQVNAVGKKNSIFWKENWTAVFAPFTKYKSKRMTNASFARPLHVLRTESPMENWKQTKQTQTNMRQNLEANCFKVLTPLIACFQRGNFDWTQPRRSTNICLPEHNAVFRASSQPFLPF